MGIIVELTDKVCQSTGGAGDGVPVILFQVQKRSHHSPHVRED